MGIKPSVPVRRKPPGGGGEGGGTDGTSTPTSPEGTGTDDSTAARYILHEEWLTDVCGVSTRRLTIRNNEECLLTAKPPTIGVCLEEEEPPTQEEVLQWSKSFDNLMQSKGGQRLFKNYLQSEYSDENILFWLACEDLKEEKNPELIEDKVKNIFEDYISILSPKEVSLDGKARELINKNMLNPTTHVFDDAQLQIYTLMQRDSYPRFLNSRIFLGLLER